MDKCLDFKALIHLLYNKKIQKFQSFTEFDKEQRPCYLLFLGKMNRYKMKCGLA